MADISVINVGGVDRNVKDTTSRTNSNNALSQIAYVENGNTASQPYPTIGTPINWKGTLYYTKTAVASGAAWVVGTNLTAAGNLGKLTSNIKTYVNSSGELVFRDLTGADTVLPFKGTGSAILAITSTRTAATGSDYRIYMYYIDKTDVSNYRWDYVTNANNIGTKNLSFCTITQAQGSTYLPAITPTKGSATAYRCDNSAQPIIIDKDTTFNVPSIFQAYIIEFD